MVTKRERQWKSSDRGKLCIKIQPARREAPWRLVQPKFTHSLAHFIPVYSLSLVCTSDKTVASCHVGRCELSISECCVILLQFIVTQLQQHDGKSGASEQGEQGQPNFCGGERAPPEVCRCDRLTVMTIYMWKSPAFVCFCFLKKLTKLVDFYDVNGGVLL